MPQNSENQRLFDEAVAHLSKKEYKLGIEALSAIREKGFVSADLEANLGHALVEVGQIGPGIQHLMNAVALDRFSFENRSDLLLAQSKVEGGLGQSSSHPSEIASQISSYIRPAESLALSSVLLLTLIGLFLLKKLQKSLAIGLSAALSLFLILSAFSSLSRSIYIVAKDSEIRMSPLESAEVSQSLKAGTRLRVLRTSGQFSEVERANSFNRAWIKSDSLFVSPY
jgi:hypothetical protein